MRVATLQIGQETNDFNPLPTTLGDFASYGIHEGAEVLERMRGVGQVGGCLDAVAAAGLDVEWIPIINAWGMAGGRITTEARLFFEEKIATGLRHAGRLDALAIHLHGACAAAGVDDVEGAQLALCRSILGPDIPIVLSLDHHANVTRQMVALSTVIVGHRHQPHITLDTGRIAGELLGRILRKEIHPVMAWRKLRLITHQEQFLTARAPMKIWFDQARAMEAADPRVLHVGNYPMQPWLDVAEGGWSTVVVTDGDRPLAERLADESADLAWSLRAEFLRQDSIPVDQALRQAEAVAAGVVVLSDTGDTVFGGAAGDSNLILEAILRLGIPSRALMPLVEPQTVARLVAAGQGAEVTLPVGGSLTGFFKPLTVTGRVRKITAGQVNVPVFQQPSFDQGQTVIFEVGPVTLLVSERVGAGGNIPAAYRAFGIEPQDYKMAVLKTASNFQWFAPLTSQLIRVDTRGPGQSDVASLPWRRVPRPVYPLDNIPSWR